MARMLDALVPGDGARWPSFSTAVDVANFAAALAPSLRETISAWAATLGDAPASALARHEQEEPQAFAALLTAVHRAYYTSRPVLAAVRALADAGPREPSPHFDATLVAHVMATQRGRRRL
jgi:hypothetical protein